MGDKLTSVVKYRELFPPGGRSRLNKAGDFGEDRHAAEGCFSALETIFQVVLEDVRSSRVDRVLRDPRKPKTKRDQSCMNMFSWVITRLGICEAGLA